MDDYSHCVPPEGPLDALIVLVGEAPGKYEIIHNRPFVGPSGRRLAVWWRLVGLDRSEFFITNVLPFKPANIDSVPRDIVEEHIGYLHERLARLSRPLIIVPTGNYALYACTGKGKVSWHKKDGKYPRPGISDWRGSILTYGASDVRVIPTLHPAFILRTPSLERRCIEDWTRIADELRHAEEYGHWPLPKRRHLIRPTLEAVEDFCESLVAQGLPVSLDIETPRARLVLFQMKDGKWRSDVRKDERHLVATYKSGAKKGTFKCKSTKGQPYIGCIGFANRVDESLTIPLTLAYWKTAGRLDRARAAVERVLASDLPKVVQNGVSFDIPYLRWEGYTVNGEVWDTRCMHHALDPRDDHDLATMASVYTRQPFWKHEAKDPDEIEKYAHNNDALWTYNGIDVCVTLELFYVLDERLGANNMREFFKRHYVRLVPALVDMTMHGILIDEDERKVQLQLLRSRIEELSKTLCSEDGSMSLVARKAISNDRLKYLLYGAKGFEGKKGEATYAKLREQFPNVKPFGYPPMRKKNGKGERSITVDEVTLRKLILKYPSLSTLGPQLLEFRRNSKLCEFLDPKAIDTDGRLRCSYSFVTEAARLASSGTPWRTGRNLQNIDRELRFVFIPDKETPK